VRVLHVSPYFPPAIPYGGPPASVLGLCQGLQRAGVDVEVVTTTANGDAQLAASPATGDRYDGVPVRYVQMAFPRRFFGARVRGPLVAALARADVCHIHGVWNVPEWWASYLARARKLPYVVSPRGMLLPQAVRRGRWRKAVAYQLIERANLRGAALLHATSEQEADALRDLQLGAQIAVVPNGVDLESAQRAPLGYRRQIGIPPDAFVVLYLGRMHRIKRLDLLADAFDELRATHRSAHLVLAGHDEHGLIPDLRRRLSAHALFVHTLDAVGGQDKWALLRDADVTVQCSDSESFGMSIVESLAAGVPAVVTRTCPWQEIETRECGLWVEQRAPAIAAALRALADDPARRRRMGDRAAALARERYGWDAIAPLMSRLYAGLL
jgi:glycosyltransferase involved in cell wall biosynthesis